MKKNIVITISREFGSGGREIGERVAKELGIPFYDREIILKSAENSGLSEEYIEKEEQKVTNSLLFNLSAGGYGKQEFPALADRIFIAQSGVIQEYAQEGSCVIVGRCSDYILKDNKNCLNFFIHANKYFKLHRIMKKYALDQEEAEKKIKETDKRRSRHYRFYTSQQWGDASNYHVCINSGKLGIDNAVKVIVNIANNV